MGEHLGEKEGTNSGACACLASEEAVSLGAVSCSAPPRDDGTNGVAPTESLPGVKDGAPADRRGLLGAKGLAEGDVLASQTRSGRPPANLLSPWQCALVEVCQSRRGFL